MDKSATCFWLAGAGGLAQRVGAEGGGRAETKRG